MLYVNYTGIKTRNLINDNNKNVHWKKKTSQSTTSYPLECPLGLKRKQKLSVGKDVEKSDSQSIVGGNGAIRDRRMVGPQKVKHRMATGSSDSISWHATKWPESWALNRCLCDRVHSGRICWSRKVGAPQVSTDRWMDKQNVVCIYTNGTVLSLGDKGCSDTCSNMDEPWEQQVSGQSLKDKSWIIPPVWGAWSSNSQRQKAD